MKHLNFFSKRQSCGHSSVTLASTVGSPSAHRRSTMLKLLSVLVLIFTFGIGQMWGAEGDTHDFTQTLEQNLNNGVSIDDITIDEQTYPIKKVSVTCRYNKTAGGFTVSVTVDGNTFGTPQTLNSSTTTTFNFEGESTKGEVVVSFTNNCTGSSKQGTCYCTNVRLTEGAAAGPTLYTVTYDANGGEVTPASHKQASAGASITLATPTREGYSFNGWYTATSGGTKRGDAGASYTPTSNETVHAQWTINNYPVHWKVNGNEWEGSTHGNPSTSANYDTKPTTIPTAPISNNCDGKKVFVGWTNTEYSHASTAPTVLFTSQSSAPTITEETTFHAVFANASSGGSADITITNSDFTGVLTNSYADKTITKGDYTFYLNACKQDSKCQMKKDKGCYILIPTLPGAITNISTTACANASGSSYSGTLRLKSSDSAGDGTTNDLATKELSGVTSFSWDVSGNITTAYFKTSAGLRLQNLTITYSSTTYTNYSTTCCHALGSINGSVSWTNAQATASWDDVTGMSNWKLYRSEHNADSWTEVTGLSASAGRYSNSTAISGLTAGQEYDFKVTGTYSGSTYCAQDYTFTFSSIAPKITTGTISGASTYKVGNGPGTKQTFTVSAVGLDDDLTVSAPTNFLICDTENGTYGNSVTLNHSEGTVASTTIYLQLAADLAVNDYNANVSISGGGAESVNVAVSGVVSPDCSDPTINTQPAATTTCNMGATVSLEVLATKNGTGPALTYQWYSNTSNNNTSGTPVAGETNSTYTPSTATAGTKYYYCVVYSGACFATSDIATVTVNTPVIKLNDATSNINLGFGDKAVGPESPYYTMNFTVSGENLAKNAPITIGFTGAAGMFSVDQNSIDQTTGSISATTITVTYNPTAAGSHAATLTIGSTGATSRTVSLSGTGKWPVTWSVAGQENPTTNLAANNAKPTLPTPAPADNTLGCANTFMGWSAKNGGSVYKDTEYYDDLFSDADDAPAITGNAEFFAVFATQSGSDPSYITFDNSASDGSDAISSNSESVNAKVTASSGVSYQTTGSSRVYAGTYGMKIGANGGPGVMVFTVSPAVTTKTIKVNAKKYGSDTGTLSLTVNGEDFGEAQSPTSEGGELTFTVDNAVEVTSVTVATSSKRAYIKTVSVGEGATKSNYVTVCPAVEAPTFSPAAGEYHEAKDVTISCATVGYDEIRYTTDGNDPTKTTGTVYSKAITVDETTTIKAIAVKGDNVSDVVSATYTITYPRTVTFNAGTGTLSIAPATSITEEAYGEGITLPSATPSSYCVAEGWTFAGWATTNSTTTAPTIVSGTYTPESDITLYAVYQQGDENYHLVTELPTGEDIPGKYVMVYTDGKVALEAATVTGKAYQLYGASIYAITDGVIDPENIDATYRAKSIWDVTYESNHWIFKNDNTSKYLYGYISGNYHNISIQSDKPTGFDVSLSNGYAVISSADANDVTVFYSTTDSKFEGTDGDTKNIHLYKQSTPTYSSTPVCCDDEVTISKADDPSTGKFTLDKSGVLSTCAGSQVVTVNCTPNPGYHVDEVTETIGTDVTIEETAENVYTVTYAKNVSGTSTISVTFAETLEPSFQISETAFEIGDVAVGATVQRQFTISAAHLEGTSMSISSSNDKFSVSPTSLTIKADGSVDEASVTVTLNTPEANIGGPYSATITLADEATTPNTATVSLTNATIKNQYNVKWYNGTDLLSEANYLDGATISDIPTAASCDESISHVGWLPNATIDGKQADAPASMVANEDLPAVTADVEYHAVFAKVGEESWRNTALADLTSEDVFVIAETSGYALSHANGTSSAPAAPSITIADGKITSEVTAAMKWKVSGNATDGYTFYPNGSTTTWLYCNNSNNGVRVGTSDSKVFKINGGYLQNTTNNRYVGVYTDNPDWRCYDNTTGNLSGQSFAYFKYNAPTAKDYMTTCAVTFTATYEAGAGTGDDYEDANLIEKNANYTVLGNDVTGFSKNGYRFNGWKCSDDDYAAGATYENVTADLTFVAQWAEKEEAGLEYATSAYEVIQNGSFTKPTLTNPYGLDVTYSSSNESVATVDAEGNVTLKADAIGTTVITATSEATDTYKAGEASYTLSVASKWALTYTSNVNVGANEYTVTINSTTYANQSHRYGTGSAAGVATINVPKNTQKLHFHAAAWNNETVKLTITLQGEEYPLMTMVDDALVRESDISGTKKTYTLTGKTSTDEYYCLDLSSYTIATNTTITFTATSGNRFLLYGVNEEGGIWELPSADADESDIPSEVNVVVNEDQSLTINNTKTLNNLTVEAGGTVSGTANLTVNNLTINSEAGASGQYTGTGAVTINGDLVLEIKLCDDELDASKYYCISAPFAVSAFEWGNGNTMVFNQDYQLFKYDGDKRARTGNGWQRVGATMEANTAYFIIFDSDNTNNQNVIRLKAANKTIPTTTSIALAEHEATYGQTDAEKEKNSNWNGLGNPTLHYVGLNKTVSVFEASSQTFEAYPWQTHNNGFVVGTAFFAKDQTESDMTFGNPVTGDYRAPRRESAEEYIYCVEIAKENASRYDNRLYVMASETASTSFEGGKDLPTMNGETSNYGALIWTKNYGMRLAVEEAPMVNNKASYELGIFAPMAGTYSISVAAPQENAELYLTKNGHIIWNLTMSPCELELTQGQNEGYGLILRANVPSVSTDVEGIQPSADSIQKVIIDEKVFILRGSKMYGVDGKEVR